MSRRKGAELGLEQRIAALEAIARQMGLKKDKPDPICEECSEPMHRYGPAVDTGKMGWGCDSCGWSQDD